MKRPILIGHSDALMGLLRVAYREGRPVGVDTETSGCDPRTESPYEKARLECWSLGIPDCKGGFRRAFLTREDLLPMLPWLESDAAKVFHNANYDRHVFRNEGIQLGGEVLDTADMARLVDPEGSHGLKFLMGARLGVVGVGEYSELFTRPVIKRGSRKLRTFGPKQKGGRVEYVVEEYEKETAAREYIPLSEITKDHPLYGTLVDYATLDAWATAALFCVLKTDLEKVPCKRGTAWDIYVSMFLPISYLLFDMSCNGFQIDSDFCYDRAVSAEEDKRRVLAELAPWSGETNWASWQQIDKFLLSIGEPRSPVCKKGKVKRGKIATDSTALEYIADHTQNDAVRVGLRKVLQLRKTISSLKYLNKLPLFVDCNGRVHPVGGATTATGRLAMSKPEVQQIPKDKRKDAYQVRRSFIAGPGKVLVVRDASQLEMRIQAHLHNLLFNDPTLANDISAADCHSANAIRVFGAVYPEKVLSTGGLFKDLPLTTDLKTHPDKWARERRDDIKAVIYGIGYGKGAYGLGYTLRDDEGEPVGEAAAELILDGLFSVYPAIPKLQNWIREFIEANGYIPSLLGRRRYLDGAQSPEKRDRERAYRQALNNPMQAGGAEVVMLWMLEVERIRKERGIDALLVLQCHDELVYECDPDDAGELSSILEDCLVAVGRDLQLTVPLKGDGNVGNNWYDAK